jgi:undecaprenyl diphosphate synthase
LTANNDRHVYNVALDYGGQDEVLRAGERLVDAARKNPSNNELRITDFLDTAGQPHPEPDIVLRSSGERRVSGFMPLQTIYSELFFVDELFPDVTFDVLKEVAIQFRWRKRRFGG